MFTAIWYYQLQRITTVAVAHLLKFGTLRFPIPERKQAAECILNDFIAEFRVGNFWE
jgi:hypothetical protein